MRYRDLFVEQYGIDVASVVGCGLDQLAIDVMQDVIIETVNYYNAQKDAWKFSRLSIGVRRELIADYARDYISLSKCKR